MQIVDCKSINSRKEGDSEAPWGRNLPLGKGDSKVFVAKAKKTERQRGKPWFSLGEPSKRAHVKGELFTY